MSEEIYRHVLGRVLIAARPGTQRELADAAGVTQSTLSRFERAQLDLGILDLRRLVGAAAPNLPFPEFLARVECVYEAALALHAKLPGDGDVAALAQLAMAMAPALALPCHDGGCARPASAVLRCPMGCGTTVARCLQHGGFTGVGEALDAHVAACHRGT